MDGTGHEVFYNEADLNYVPDIHGDGVLDAPDGPPSGNSGTATGPGGLFA